MGRHVLYVFVTRHMYIKPVIEGTIYWFIQRKQNKILRSYSVQQCKLRNTNSIKQMSQHQKRQKHTYTLQALVQSGDIEIELVWLFLPIQQRCTKNTW